MRVLGKRIVKLDVKDRGHTELRPKDKVSDAVGTDGGEVHWKNLRDELKKTNFSGWATAEVKGGGKERLTRMSSWMRGILGLS